MTCRTSPGATFLSGSSLSFSAMFAIADISVSKTNARHTMKLYHCRREERSETERVLHREKEVFRSSHGGQVLATEMPLDSMQNEQLRQVCELRS